MKKLRLILTLAVIGIMTAAIGAAPVTKRVTATRVAPSTQSTPRSGSDALTEPSSPTAVAAPQATVPVAAGVSGGPINMDWYTINNGGAIEVASGNIKMGLSIGQSAVGEVSAGNIKMGLGFWYGASSSAVPSCECDCHADPKCDSVTNIFDVTNAVNVAFRGGDPILDSNVLCPLQTTDVNCDSVTSIFDVARFVNVAFRGGDRDVEFCSPCAPNL